MRSKFIDITSLPYPVRPAIALVGIVPLLWAWWIYLAVWSDGAAEFVEADGWTSLLQPHYFDDDTLRTGHSSAQILDYYTFIMDGAAANAGGHDNARLPPDSFTEVLHPAG